MNRKRTSSLLAVTALLVALGIGSAALRSVAPAAAQTSPSYNLEWHVIGSGGQPVTSASYAVNSTAGQGATSPPASIGSHYTVSGGYWFSPFYMVYLPLVLRN
jgi:hypothetical protein